MSNAVVISDAFKFLDIRPQRKREPARRVFIIDRSELTFDDTAFEKTLKGLARDGQYAAKLQAIATEELARDRTPDIGTFIDLVNEAMPDLQDGSLPPEEIANNLSARIPSQADMEQKLTIPVAALWDSFLAATLADTYGKGSEGGNFASLSAAIRVAAALMTLRDKPNEEFVPSRYILGSINIDSNLIDVQFIRSKVKPIDRKPSDTTARVSQDSLANETVRLQLALAELRQFLQNWQNANVANVPPAPTGNQLPKDVSLLLVPKDDVISIPDEALSVSTRDLLTHEYGGKAGAGQTDGINIVRVISMIDVRLRAVGAKLFASASADQILTATQQVRLLQYDLSRSVSKAVDAAKLARLPLLLPTPILGTPPVQSPATSSIRALGIGDLKVVKQTLVRYNAGEVAHIENVLEGQTKERLHSVKQSTEDTLFVSTERTTSVEKDLQSTDRFELSDETQNTIKQQRENETGVTVSASYGAVSISANTRFNDSSTNEQSSKVSRQFARDVVSRSVEKIEQKVREDRTRKTVLQVEETNRYSQSATGKNIVGLYRWVDKIYSARVYVYGKRMMLEFMVPEPASVFLRSRTILPEDPGAVPLPEPLNFTSSDIEPYNYAGFAARYGAEVAAPPPPVRAVHMASRSSADTQPTKIELDEGWVAVRASTSAAWVAHQGGWLLIQIGHAQWSTDEKEWYSQPIDNVVKEVPVTVTSLAIVSSNVMASVIAMPSQELEEKWRLDTYKAIRTAYELRLSEYRDYLASKRQAELSLEVARDSENRAIERRELKRGCIELLTNQHFDSLGAVVDNANSGWPEIDFKVAPFLGEISSYFEQSFEWSQMTYLFYPYFWGRQSEWRAKLAIGNTDNQFNAFLSSGMARIVVPVRPAHESDVAYFLATGVIWWGSEPPTIGDPRYVDIVDEIKESLDAPDGGVPEGDAWQVKVPTSLVILDESTTLPSFPDQPAGQPVFTPSSETCSGIPYNLAQWPDSGKIIEAIGRLGYRIPKSDDADASLKKARPTIRAMQSRFNHLGAAEIIGRPLNLDGFVGPCTLRALSYFTALKDEEKWPGVG
ncbi:hypothetical protein ACC792_31990 [Rhizobium ruizarguesonis]